MFNFLRANSTANTSCRPSSTTLVSCCSLGSNSKMMKFFDSTSRHSTKRRAIYSSHQRRMKYYVPGRHFSSLCIVLVPTEGTRFRSASSQSLSVKSATCSSPCGTSQGAMRTAPSSNSLHALQRPFVILKNCASVVGVNKA
jgi:hypothetical protein